MRPWQHIILFFLGVLLGCGGEQRKLAGMACQTDGECASAFCNAGVCSTLVGMLGKGCDEQNEAALQTCGSYVCVDGRCRSCDRSQQCLDQKKGDLCQVLFAVSAICVTSTNISDVGAADTAGTSDATVVADDSSGGGDAQTLTDGGDTPEPADLPDLPELEPELPPLATIQYLFVSETQKSVVFGKSILRYPLNDQGDLDFGSGSLVGWSMSSNSNIDAARLHIPGGAKVLIAASTASFVTVFPIVEATQGSYVRGELWTGAPPQGFGTAVSVGSAAAFGRFLSANSTVWVSTFDGAVRFPVQLGFPFNQYPYSSTPPAVTPFKRGDPATFNLSGVGTVTSVDANGRTLVAFANPLSTTNADLLLAEYDPKSDNVVTDRQVAVSGTYASSVTCAKFVTDQANFQAHDLLTARIDGVDYWIVSFGYNGKRGALVVFQANQNAIAQITDVACADLLGVPRETAFDGGSNRLHVLSAGPRDADDNSAVVSRVELLQLGVTQGVVSLSNQTGTPTLSDQVLDDVYAAKTLSFQTPAALALNTLRQRLYVLSKSGTPPVLLTFKIDGSGLLVVAVDQVGALSIGTAQDNAEPIDVELLTLP